MSNSEEMQQQAYETMLKKIQIIGSVRTTNWKIVGLIREGYQCNQIELLSFQGNGWVKPETDDEILRYLHNDRNWSTYSSCRTAKINALGEVTVEIFDGDNMYGQRQGRRWEAKFRLVEEDMKTIVWELKDTINGMFKNAAEDELDRRKRKAREQAIQMIEQEFLSGDSTLK